MASTGLNEESVEKKLMSVTNTQDSIQSLSLWIIHHKNHYAYIVELWYRVMKKSAKPSHRLTLFYLCNDVVQTCKRKKAQIFVNAFKPLLKNATALVRDAAIRPKVERIFCVWEERQVFDKDFVTELRAILDGKQADGAVFKKPFSPTPRERLKERAKQKSKEKKKEAPATSSVAEEPSAGKDSDAAVTPEKEEETKKEEEVPSEEMLATFKPTELIQKVQSFKKQTSEVKNSEQKLGHLKLDASSIEAVKQLKDRAHGNEFSNDFEESCLRLDETAEGLEKLKSEQKDLLTQLHIAEHFYSQQHSEARIVANAYKTYGARINSLSKKLGEMLKTLPSSVKSPPPPPAQSLSPGNTPPGELYEPMDYQLGGSDDSHPGSPNGDAGGSPSMAGEVSYSQASGVDPLEKRLTSFIPSLGSSSSMSDEEHPIPVYIPQPTMSNGSTSSRRPSANRTLTDSEDPFPSEEGGSTPLTDEPPTTPVMDEEPESSPSPPPPPPPPPPPLEKHKENPIDFLSRLISQSQKNSTPPSTGVNNSFLANFTKLTSQMKQGVPRTTARSEKEEKEDVTGGGSPRPRCWAEWKKEKAVEMTSRVEQPDTSLPPPLIPGFPPTSSGLAPMGVPPPPPLTVRSLPMLSAPPLPPLTIPPPGSQSSLTPLMVPPPPPPAVSPISNPALPSLSSPSSLPPPGMHHAPPGSLASMPPLSSPSSLGTRISPVALPSAPPPPISPSSISPRALSVVSSQPVPSPNLSMPSSAFFEHTSPGQKENWPEAGEGMEEGEDMMPSPGMEYSVDMPFPPVGLRMRSNSSVLKELTPSTEEMSVSEASSILSPPPSSEGDGKLTQTCEEEVSAIATLSSSPGRGGQGYMDKLKTKGSRGYLPSTYVHNPNLTTLTPGGDGDEDEEDEEDDEEEEEEDEEENGATRIPVLSSVVRRVDPREKRQDREKDRHSFRDRDSKYPHSSSKHRGETFRRDRRYSRENNEDDYLASGYSHRDGRPYDHESVHPTSDYPPCPENPYDNRGYDSYPYGQSSTSRQLHKYGISQGSSHRSYRH